MGVKADLACRSRFGGRRAPNLRPDHVTDGDTMRYSGEVYRLVGFDTPEHADNACRRAQASRDGIDLDQQFAFSMDFR